MSHPLYPGRLAPDDPDLSDRQRGVFRAMVELHAHSARPVGSERLAMRADIGHSPAAVRQDLAELERLGLLERSHCSSGRVPTPRGWELYVRTMVVPQALDAAMLARMDDTLMRSRRNVEDLLDDASRLLASVTRQLGLALAGSLVGERLAELDLETVGDRRVLLAIGLEGGAVRTLVLELESPLGREALHEVAAVLRERLFGRTLREVRAALEHDPEIVERSAVRIVARAAARSWANPVSTPLYSAGAMHMAELPEFADGQHLAPLLHAVETGSPLGRLLDGGVEGQVGVRVGLDAESGLGGCSLVTYTLPGTVRAAIGVLGPLRMDYALACAVVDRVGARMTEILHG